MVRSPMVRNLFPLILAPAAAALLSLPATAFADEATPGQILAYKPKQPDVDVDVPPAAEVDKCEIQVVKSGKGLGYLLTAPNGLTLRRFEDSTGDEQLDRYRYYKDGLEVYRDIDSDGDATVDQYRWYQTAGSRHGADVNGDGKIDRWLRISAEEATREAVRAMAAGDAAALAAVVLDARDAKALGLSPAMSEALVTPPQKLTADLKAVLASKAVGRGSVWTRFDATPSMPAVVPAESGKAARDVAVYGNGIISVETGGKPGFLIAGEVVQVGDAWKLTGVPQGNDGAAFTVAGLLSIPMQNQVGMASGLSEAQQAIIAELDGLDLPKVGDGEQAFARYNVARAGLLKELLDVTPPGQGEEWTAELIDVIATGVEGNAYPNGLKELARLEQSLEGDLKQRATFRRIVAGYSDTMRNTPAEEQPAVNDQFLKDMEAFVRAYPKSPDTPYALLQLASGHELSGDMDEATKWYQAAAATEPPSPPSEQAKGALRRLNLKGRPLPLTGPTLDGKQLDLSRYKGKVVAVVFWASPVQPSADLVEPLKKMLAAYRRNGFEVVGVNLDYDPKAAAAFAKDNSLPWPNVRTEGGLASPTATGLGLLSASHVILVDKSGNVADENASLSELQRDVPKLLLAR